MKTISKRPRPSVLVKPASPDFIKPAATTYVLQGTTPNFQVSYDSTLGSNGASLASAVLNTCEVDYAWLKSLFGGLTPTGLPFQIYIDSGYGGAYHASCAATAIHCYANAGNDSDLLRFLVVAEVDEVMMATQGAGWNCGFSNGEGLSRVLATDRYPAQLDGFESANSWLNTNPRPNWVDTSEPTDRDYVSIGCSTLFINYLRSQWGFPTDIVVQSGAKTLAVAYEGLTGRSDAFQLFAELLALTFPAGTLVNLDTDNPFPLGWGAWHTLRNTDGSYSNFDFVESASRGGPPYFTAISSGSADSQSFQVVGVGSDGKLWHTLRNSDGSWVANFGPIEGVSSGGPSSFAAVGSAGADQDLHVVGVGNDGNLWHTLRKADGSWTPTFGLIENRSSGGPPSFNAVSCGSADGQALQVVGVGSDGNLWHTIRYANGRWQPTFGLIENRSSGGPPSFVAVGCAGANQELHVVGVGSDGNLWHTIRYANGRWQPSFVRVEGLSRGGPSRFVAVSCGSPDGQYMHVVGVGDGDILETVRHPDGSWDTIFTAVSDLQRGGPPNFVAVGCSGAGGTLQVVGAGATQAASLKAPPASSNEAAA